MYFDNTIKALAKLLECANDDQASLRHNMGEWQDLKKNVMADRVEAFKHMMAKRMAEYKDEAKTAIRGDFEAAAAMVKAFSTKAPEEGMYNTLEALRTIAKTVEDAEAVMFLERYNNNYMAHAALLEVLHSEGKLKDVQHIPASKVLDVIKDHQQAITMAVDKFEGSPSYVYTLYASADKSPLVGLSDRLDGFLERGELTNAVAWG